MQESVSIRRDALQVIAYDLSNWRGFLLPQVLPFTTRMAAIVGENCESVLSRLPLNYRGTFVFSFGPNI